MLDRSLNNKIYVFGDSISRGGSPGKEYPEWLQDLVGDHIEVINYGLAGRTSATIGQLQGGVQIQLTNETNVTLPKDGTPVEVGFTMTPDTPHSTRYGVLDDMHDGKIHFKFKITDYDNKKSEISTNGADSDFTLKQFYKIPIKSDNSKMYINIIQFGRNDINYTGHYAVDDIKQNIKACVDYLKEAVDNPIFVVWSVPAKSTDIKGTDVYNKTKEVNDWIAQTYPDNFFNARQYLIDHGLTEAEITPTDADKAAIAGDAVPPSLVASDTLHPNAKAKEVEGKALYRFMSQKGMFQEIETRSQQYLKVIRNGKVVAVGDRGARSVIMDGVQVGKHGIGEYQLVFSHNDTKNLSIRTSERTPVPEFTEHLSTAAKVPQIVPALPVGRTRTSFKFDLSPNEKENSGIMTYRIYYYKDGEGEGSALTQDVVGDGKNTVRYELINLEPSTRYWVAATAINEHGESPMTDWSYYNTLTGVPAVPTMTSLNRTKNTMQFNFKPAANDASGWVRKFRLYWYRDNDENNTTITDIDNVGDDTTYLLENLQANTAYYFAGSAENEYGESATTPWEKHSTLAN